MLSSIITIDLNKIVSDQEFLDFEIEEDGIYIISILAQCKNWRQNIKHLFSDDDLAIQLDNYLFAEIKGKKREFYSPGSWNGNELKNAAKKILFILPIQAGRHKIKFWTDGGPFLKNITIYNIKTAQSIQEIILDKKLVERERLGNLFLDICFNNLTINNLTIKARVNKKSKLGLKIDGEIQVNPIQKKYKKWYWHGMELKGGQKNFQLNKEWEDGIHWLEFRGIGESIIDEIKISAVLKHLKYKVGRIKLYQDITLSKTVNFRSTPSDENNEILDEINNGEKVEILDERIEGKFIQNYSSIWHKIFYKGKEGYILSSFIEVEGQERNRIIDLIREKSGLIGVDPNIMLAIAGCESRFKPYACSKRERQGIFQLGTAAAKDMNVNDRYNFYQNIEGGVKYYKWIKDQTTGLNNVFNRRLIGWHSGIKYVLKKRKINYEELPFPEETRSFIKNVNVNLRQKDWKNITWLPVIFILFAITLNFLVLGKNRVYEQLASSDFLLNNEKRASIKNNALPQENFIFNYTYRGIHKIIVIDLRDDKAIPYTQFVYYSQLGEFQELLDGYLSNAAWINFNYADKIFLIEREIGKYLISNLYFPKNDGLHKIKFLGKNGKLNDWVNSPFEIKFIDRNIQLVEIVPNGAFQPISTKNYDYNYLNNMFIEK